MRKNSCTLRKQRASLRCELAYGFSTWKVQYKRSRIGCNCIFSLHHDDYCRLWPSWKFQIFSSACAGGLGQLLELKRTRSFVLYSMKVKVAPMKCHTIYKNNPKQPKKYTWDQNLKCIPKLQEYDFISNTKSFKH